MFAPHDAADGALARIRLPGGAVSAAALRVVAGCAEDLGDGVVHLTSRGNLQLRGLDRDDPRLAQRLAAAGLLPSPTHERVRNVLASPLSGVAGGRADVRAAAAELDRELCARPGLAELPGRFLFALDDGRGDAAAEGADACWLATGERVGTVLVAGAGAGTSGNGTAGDGMVDLGVTVELGRAAAALLAAAEAFLALRAAVGATAWRVAELPGAPARIAAALAARGLATPVRPPGASFRPPDRVGAVPVADPRQGASPRPGPVRRDDGGYALVVVPVLGQLSGAGLRLLADLAPRAVVTPWRSVVLPEPVGGEERRHDQRPRSGSVTGEGAGPHALIMLGRATGNATAHGAAAGGAQPPSAAALIGAAAPTGEATLAGDATTGGTAPAGGTALAATVARLAAAGFVVTPDSAVPAVSACAGRPGCAKALADVRADTVAALRAGRLPVGARVHVAGCERRCGAPRAPHLDVVALGEGHYSLPGFPS